MRRFLFIVLVGLIWTPALAQTPKPAQKPPAATPVIPPDQARIALDVLNDPAKRAAMVATLEAILKAQPSAAATSSGPPPANVPEPVKAVLPKAPADQAHATDALAIPRAPDSLGAELLIGASSFLNGLSLRARQTFEMVESVPLLWGWAVVMATNPLARHLLVDTAWRVLVALAVGIAVQFALRHALRRTVSRLEDKARRRFPPVKEPEPAPGDDNEAVTRTDADDFEGTIRAEAGETEPPPKMRPAEVALAALRRLPMLTARLAVELAPVVAMTVVSHGLAGSDVGGKIVSHLVILAVIDAYAACVALLAVARVLYGDSQSALTPIRLTDEAALHAWRWTRRMVLIAVIGYAFGEVALLLSLSGVAHNALQKAIGFVLLACFARIIYQQRVRVRRLIRPAPDATGLIASVQSWLARSWHVLAIGAIAIAWTAWALDSHTGIGVGLRYALLTTIAVTAIRLIQLAALAGLEKSMQAAGESTDHGGTLEARLRAYHPAAAALISSAVWVLGLLLLLQGFGLGIIGWLVATPLGQRILSALATLCVTILLAFTVWEMANIAILSHLARLNRDAMTARSARLRTLLPLLRTTLVITISVVAGLMVLSEIGVNIAPLLAGAGIVGIAIGFGSQKLVQDLITGVFLLLENAMQVGDVVKVADQSGVIESLSVRTIRLRSEDGSVHIVPFSSVTTVVNLTRDYSRAVIRIGVAYKEDYDQVIDVLRGIVREMRADPAWSNIVLDDLEVWGLDQFDDSSITIAGRVQCTPFGRWSVRREINRRAKKKFDELGIEIPFPQRKLLIDWPESERLIAAGLTERQVDAGHEEDAGLPETGKPA